MHRERLIKSATPLEFLSIKLTVYVKRGLDHFFHVYKVVGTSWFLLRNGILYSNTSMEAAAFMIIRDHRLLSGSKTSNTSKYYFYCVFYTHGNKINFFPPIFFGRKLTDECTREIINTLYYSGFTLVVVSFGLIFFPSRLKAQCLHSWHWGLGPHLCLEKDANSFWKTGPQKSSCEKLQCPYLPNL